VAADAGGNVYVADTRSRIQKFTDSGTYLTEWGSEGTGDGQFDGVGGLATDASGNVYVTDGNNRVQMFTDTGTYLRQWGTYGTGNGQFNVPSGVATDAAGNVYVADWYNNRIQKFGPGPTPVHRVTWGALKSRYRGEVGDTKPPSK
jgi:DNA-binding beta-propeller fold protein YncE